jgi:hypothetical protein
LKTSRIFTISLTMYQFMFCAIAIAAAGYRHVCDSK